MIDISFGPAGLGSPAAEGLKRCKKLGLKSAEVEFTYGVRMSNELAKEIGKKAKDLGIRLSVHAPYYINLASKEKAKIEASKKRILMSCERAHYLGASPVVFHAGFYMSRDPEKVYQIIRENIEDLQKKIRQKGYDTEIAPETTGKPTQFSGLDELLRLRKETGCSICIDFAHLYARNQGNIDYEDIMKKISFIPGLHCHFSGIIYSEKGERSHKLLEKPFFMPLASAIKMSKIRSITLINESPDTFGDAVKMRSWFDDA